jgi:hypothetical protein
VKAIREKFYETTSKLFYFWNEYIKLEFNNAIEFDCERFMRRDQTFTKDNS